jgi:hypothetical protein
MIQPTSVGQRNGVFEDRAFTRPAEGEELSCEILVVGGSTAAYSAALVAARANLGVCWVQPTQIVGGQFTTQALPASDDGDLLRHRATATSVEGERFAISKLQRQFRVKQRSLQPVKGKSVANPGGGWVSPLCTTPVVAATAMNGAIAPYIAQGKLKLIPLAEPIEVLFEQTPGQRRRVVGVVFEDVQNGRTFTVKGQVVIEATDLGDLLELGDIESRIGQEARSETGEQRLPEHPLPRCQQSFTFGAVVERTAPGKGVPIGAPTGYGAQRWLDAQEFRDKFWAKSSGNWEPSPRDFFHSFGIFRYRRLLRIAEDEKIVSPGDVTVLNWGQHKDGHSGPMCCGNDYRVGVLVGVSRDERKIHLQQARDRARAYVHFLQTHGMRDLKPRGDLTWTPDGIALEPYIREARRGVALITIRHEDVGEPFFPGEARAKCFSDSVGIGQYHYLDLHGNEEIGHVSLPGRNVYALPFSIAAGALVPINVDGLILSAKSIGTTHITNAAYRMHPVEWAIGEASGYLAALSVWTNAQPRDVVTQEAATRKLQGLLTRNGIPIFWFDDVAHDDPDFEAIQLLAVAGIVRSENKDNLHFRPEGTVNRAVVAAALVKLLGFEKISPATPSFADLPTHHWAYASVETLVSKQIVSGVGNRRFAPDQPITRQQLFFLVSKAMPTVSDRAFSTTPKDGQLLRRRELSRVLYGVLRAKLGI